MCSWSWISCLDFSYLLRGHDSPSESCCVLVNSLLCVLVCACYYAGFPYTLSSRLLPFGWLLCQGSGAPWQTRGLLVEFVFFFWYCNTFLLFYCLIFAVLSSLLCVIVWSSSSVLHPDTFWYPDLGPFFSLCYCVIFFLLSSFAIFFFVFFVWSSSSVLHPDTMYCLISCLGSLLWVSSCFEVDLLLVLCWYLPRIANF